LRRRRRRSGFSNRQFKVGWLAWGAIGVVVIGAFLFFMRQADVLAPELHEIRVDAPGTIGE
jgi:hypothetical protein